MINCDTAFEYLSNSGHRNSAELQEHLAQCPRCRRMQETLAPALSWLKNDHDVTVPRSSPTRDGSTPFLTMEAVEVAERAAYQLSHRAQPVSRILRQWGAVAARYAVAMGIGGVLMFGTMTGRPDAQISIPAAAATPSLADCTRLQFGQLDFHAPAVDPKHVVMSCVACHLASR